MVATRLRAAARTIASPVMLRVAPTGRVVKDLPDWAGFGNQLFFFLWASTQTSQGVDFRLVRSPRSQDWITQFPMLAELTIPRTEVRLGDRRDDTSWEQISSVDHPGAATHEDMRRFIARYLLPSGIFRRRADFERGLTVNVRRGDYYSDPKVRGLFSFDQIAYIETVLEARKEGRYRPEVIRVVSDDIAWCQARLQHLQDYTDELAFVATGDPISDLRAVACSRELIIMNSSFSIWAAYISNYLYEDNLHLVHVPAFGTRPFDGTHWPSLDRRWDIVSTIPGGWDS